MIHFQIYEWVQYLRVCGKIQPTKRNPALNKLLVDVGLINEPEEERIIKRKVMLSQEDTDFISTIEGVNSSDVKPIATLLHKTSIQRNDRKIVFHTKEFDIKKQICGHFVGLVFPLQDFTPYQQLSSLESMKFGNVTHIIEANVSGEIKTFLKVELLKTVDYRFGGYWFAISEKTPTTILVRPSTVSEPLITRLEGQGRVAILNSKMTIPNLEASLILEHEGVVE